MHDNRGGENERGSGVHGKGVTTEEVEAMVAQGRGEESALPINECKVLERGWL